MVIEWFSKFLCFPLYSLRTHSYYSSHNTRNQPRCVYPQPHTDSQIPGRQFNYELKGGAPVRLSNVTIGENVPVSRQDVGLIEVLYSSGAILNL